MLPPPVFTSQQEHVARLGDVDFWQPYVAEALRRHGMAANAHDPVAGFNATYPTFLCGAVVVKLFGGTRAWRASYASERATLRRAAADPAIVAPSLRGEGYLYTHIDASWPYLISSRVAGVAAWRAALTHDEWRALAGELGQQVQRIHALDPAGIPTDTILPALHVAAAAAHSSLPPHLVAQVARFVTRIGPSARDDRVVVHGDLVKNHAYVRDGRLVGIIDWGDALVTDRHYEIIQLYRDMFGCDKPLLRVFLDAYGWPMEREFPRKALAQALRRQAVGLAQHHTMDVFAPIAARYPLGEIGSLDELATTLFAM